MKRSGYVFIGDQKIGPQEKVTIDFPLPSYYGLASPKIPIFVHNASAEGPTLLVTACIHGDEINGMKIAQRLIAARNLDMKKGRLIVLPVVNVYGMLAKSRYLPDRRDLNRSFPGSRNGSLASRLAHLLLTLTEQADYVVDLHTGSVGKFNIPQIRCDYSDPAMLKLLGKCNIPYIVKSSVRDGSLRGALADRGTPCFVFEGGEGLRLDKAVTKQGVQFIKGLMRALGMVGPLSDEVRTKKFLIAKSFWLRAPSGGIVANRVAIGRMVEKNAVLGDLKDIRGTLVDRVIAYKSGVVLGMNTSPLVMAGDALYHVGYGESVANEEDDFICEEHYDE